MAARSRDSQAGWGIYRATGYSLPLEEINEKLQANGFNSVALRTYNHYRKLPATDTNDMFQSTNSTLKHFGILCGAVHCRVGIDLARPN